MSLQTYHSHTYKESHSIASICNYIRRSTQYKILSHCGYHADSLVYRSKKPDGSSVVLKLVLEYQYAPNSEFDAMLRGGDIYEGGKFVQEPEVAANLHLLASPIPNIACPFENHIIIEETYVKSNLEHISKYNLFVYESAECDLHACELSELSLTTKDLIVYNLVQGLKSIHEDLKITHGDIKPMNVLLKHCLPTWIDFGTAEYMSTKEYYLKNTWGWMTPLQCLNHLYDEDCYANLSKDLCLESIDGYKRTLTELLVVADDGTFPEGHIFYEDCVTNDLFCMILLILYIYGNGYNFYSQKEMLNYDTMCILENMETFVRCREAYVSKALYDVGMKEDDKLRHVCYKGLVNPANITIDDLVGAFKIEK